MRIPYRFRGAMLRAMSEPSATLPLVAAVYGLFATLAILYGT